MDAARFDSLARALSRRGILGAVLGGAAALTARDALAACRAGGVACARDGQCCSGDCLGNGTCSCRKPSGRSVGCEVPDLRPCEVARCAASGRCTSAPAREGKVCRAAAGECDVAEACDGSSRGCPADAGLPDGGACGDPTKTQICCGGQCCADGNECDQAPTKRCCIPQGFEEANRCDGEADTRCCAGNVCREINADNGFRCRPEGCVPKGQPCTGGVGTCCSFTCSGGLCS